MPSCLVFRNDAPVIDLKIKFETPTVYFANASNGNKDAYQVHEYVKVDPVTKVKSVYQVAYDNEPSNEEVERAIIELNAEPIETS
ncbi:hypothetical protein [Pantoea trifolii]|uniref:hypothetical protein n=1 Tax=Candidatus Pantoea symbiotica TaxID=1884370 RepID=UPI00241304C5|nr:hypothetical protein [Pantoea rodasii]